MAWTTPWTVPVQVMAFLPGNHPGVNMTSIGNLVRPPDGEVGRLNRQERFLASWVVRS